MSTGAPRTFSVGPAPPLSCRKYWLPTCTRSVEPAVSIVVVAGPVWLSPLRSCWKVSSAIWIDMAAPGTIDVALLVKLPLLSTFHTRN